MEQNKSKRRLKKLLKHISIHNECTPLNTSSNLNQFEDEDFVISPEVKDALRQNIPVVALESTVISHGLPYPENMNLALSLEKIVRENHCVPCTIAIIDGKIKMGLQEDEILRLANTKSTGEKIYKVSIQDISWVIAKKACGATTVAATSFLASKIGIRVFATGGIGGVHRDGHVTMDISADLQELSRCPIIVVCAGVKSILDIPRTLEYLETMGVSVVGYKTDEFPSFFSRRSGCKAPLSVQSAYECAKMMHTNVKLNVGKGIIVGVPIDEKNESESVMIEESIQKALKEADSLNITGKDVTPFLLKRVSEITEGKSLSSNIALLKQNAKVASEISLELSKLEKAKSKGYRDNIKITVIGGMVLDIHGRPMNSNNQNLKNIEGLSIPGDLCIVPGGVGRNIAEGLAKLKINTTLITAIGTESTNQPDYFGKILIDECKKQNINLKPILITNANTAVFTSLANTDGSFRGGVADMKIFDSIKPDILNHQTFIKQMKNSDFIVMDSNIPKETIKFIAEFADMHRIPVFYEPTSSHKCLKIVDDSILPKITFIKPNLSELETICKELNSNINTKDINGMIKLLLDAGVKNVILTMGEKGVIYGTKRESDYVIKQLKPPEVKEIVDANGAGDSFSAGFIFGHTNGYSIEKSLKLGHQAAKSSLESKFTVNPNLSPHIIDLE